MPKFTEEQLKSLVDFINNMGENLTESEADAPVEQPEQPVATEQAQPQEDAPSGESEQKQAQEEVVQIPELDYEKLAELVAGKMNRVVTQPQPKTKAPQEPSVADQAAALREQWDKQSHDTDFQFEENVAY